MLEEYESTRNRWSFCNTLWRSRRFLNASATRIPQALHGPLGFHDGRRDRWLLDALFRPPAARRRVPSVVDPSARHGVRRLDGVALSPGSFSIAGSNPA